MEKDNPFSLAAIDIGSNTLRLACACPHTSHPNSLKIFLRKLYTTRLGEGFESKASLSPLAMQRAIKAIKEIDSIVSENHLKMVQLVTTGVVREAENREEFLQRIKNETGLDVKVLDGEKEAEFTMLGVQATLPNISAPFIACDIGGGSTEFALLRHDGHIKYSSISLGAIRLLERFKVRAPLQKENYNEITAYIQKRLSDLFAPSDVIKKIVATAGTPTNLASIDMSLKTYNPTIVHGYRIKLKKIIEIFEHIANMNISARRGIVGLQRGREDIIVTGTALLICIMQRFNTEYLIVSEGGVLEGILAKTYKEKKGVPPKIFI